MAKRWHTNSLTSKPWKQLKGLKLNRLQHKYLGIIIDLNFVFKIHTEKLVFKLKLKWSFFLWNKFSSSLQARKYLISATFLSQYFLDYSDLFFLNASDQCLPLCFMFYYWMWKLHAHRLFTNCFLNHPFLLGLAFSYLCTCAYKYITGAANTLKVRTPVGKRAFNYPSPFKWNNLKKDPKLLGLVTMGRL